MRRVFAVLLACSAPAAPVRNEHPTPVAASPLSRARDLELGRGVARDYRAAADIYRDACRDGQGDATACRALMKAYLRARGVPLDQQAATDLGTKLCLAHEDAFGCVIAALASAAANAQPTEPLAGKIQRAIDDRTCDAQHLATCDADLLLAGFQLDVDDVATERRNDASHLDMCRVGLVDGCTQVRDKGAADEVHRMLDKLCDDGDADACTAAPDRDSPDAAALCKAHDFDACGMAACFGDADAGAAAELNHAKKPLADCNRLRAEAGDAAKASADLHSLVDRVCACTDKTCSVSLYRDIALWSPGAKATAPQKTDNAAQLARARDCMGKL